MKHVITLISTMQVKMIYFQVSTKFAHPNVLVHAFYLYLISLRDGYTSIYSFYFGCNLTVLISSTLSLSHTHTKVVKEACLGKIKGAPRTPMVTPKP